MAQFKIGVLVYDDSDRAVAVKLVDAVATFALRTGQIPDTCIVNPVTWGEQFPEYSGIKIVKSDGIKPNLFWVGTTEDAQNAAAMTDRELDHNIGAARWRGDWTTYHILDAEQARRRGESLEKAA